VTWHPPGFCFAARMSPLRVWVRRVVVWVACGAAVLSGSFSGLTAAPAAAPTAAGVSAGAGIAPGVSPAASSGTRDRVPWRATVGIERGAGTVAVTLDGRLFTTYFFGDAAPKTYFHPILAVDGTQLSRSYPMADVPGEARDHPHHRGLWFAHGSVNGVDFWAEKAGTTGRIVSTGQPTARVDPGSDEAAGVAVIEDRRRWLAPDGRQVCTDRLSVRITPLPNGSQWDVTITLEAPADAPLVLGDTKEGTFALRLARWMTLPHRAQGRDEPGVGQMVNSTGASGAGIWGQRAEWVDYFAPREGIIHGVAFFDAPTNPRHPTWWHVRDYGLFAANPFGRHDFEGLKDQPRIGDLTVPAGQSITFRYGVYIHLGDTAAGEVAWLYRQFAGRGQP